MTLDHTLADPAARDRLLADALRGLYVGDPVRGRLVGGRAEALRVLRGYDADRYGHTRNFVDAPVSRLSPYLRHGMVSPPEVRDHLRERYAGQPEVAAEFLKQLAWRDFFEHVLDYYGNGLADDLEPAKHGVQRLNVLPPDVAKGATGLPCADGWLGRLFADGYLHNHERLWLAAYLCHWRGVDWRAGARLFQQHLYDGHVASNNASWQWVEGTFASKPYYMNQENIAHFSKNEWCAGCTVRCPFVGSYEQLQHRLFAGSLAPLAGAKGRELPSGRGDAPAAGDDGPAPVAFDPPAQAPSAVWVHDAAVSPADAALRAAPGATPVFVFDAPRLRAEPWAFHRLAFVFDGVCELFADRPDAVVAVGDPAAVFRRLGVTELAVTDSPNPGVREPLAALPGVTVRTLPRPVLADYPHEPKRFSRYWETVAPQVLGYKPARKTRRDPAR